jgi:hypothetical protein
MYNYFPKQVLSVMSEGESTTNENEVLRTHEEVLRTHDEVLRTKQDVLHFIVRQINNGIPETEIMDMLQGNCNWLEFGVCREMDKDFGTGQFGGYWRDAYNFPKVGDIRSPPWAKGEEWIVVSAGFFTFNMLPRSEVEQFLDTFP